MPYTVEFLKIREPISNHIRLQSEIGNQLVDCHRFVECLEDFKPPVVPIRELLNAGLDWRGHSVPLLKFDQGFVRERGELIVTQAFDLGFEFILDDTIVEASLYEHIHVLDIVVAAGDRLEQENIFVAD